MFLASAQGCRLMVFRQPPYGQTRSASPPRVTVSDQAGSDWTSTHGTTQPEHKNASAANPAVGVGEFAEILRRRWRTIAATTALLTVLGGSAAVLMKSQFTATTLIFVDPRSRASFQIEGTGVGGSYDPNLVDSQIVLIESDTVLRRVIANEKLLEDAELKSGPGDAAFNVMRNLKEAIKVKRPDRTYVVEVQVRTTSGEKSARIANAIAAAYLTDGRDSKSETASRELSWLDTHLDHLQGRLKKAEADVETYKVNNKILGVRGELIGEQQLGELNRSIVDAQRKVSEAKSALDQVDDIRRSGRIPDTTSAALSSPAIERLRLQMSEVLRLEANARSTLGPRHPAAQEIREQVTEARRQINEELGRIAAGARSNYAIARANVAALERQLDTLKTDANKTNQTLLRLRELERAVDAQKAVYEKFLRDKEQIARLTVDTPAGRVIAPAAVPQTRSFPNRPLIAAISMIAGLFSGIGLALLLETFARARAANPFSPREELPLPAVQVQPSPATPDDTGQSGLIAMLPAAPQRTGLRWIGNRKTSAEPTAATLHPPDSIYAREMDVLAERIRTMVDPSETTTLLISGVKSGSTNSALAANLALALTRSGLPVMLVDGSGLPDGVNAIFPKRGPVLTLAVAGRSQLVSKVAESADAGLYLLPFGGMRPPLGKRKPPTAGHCAIVLIDGPAIGSSDLDRIDIEQMIDGVIAVLPGGMGEASAAARACSQRFGSSLIGMVGQAA
ncbi:eps_transp_fam, exopolysaccharide transport protein family [Rhabdaerophilaceae bacterium]